MNGAMETDDPLIGEIVTGGFRLVSAVASGGVSTVYHGLREDGGEAAVKMLAALYLEVAAIRQRFEREAELLKILDGEGVPRLYQVGEIAGRPYQVLEFLHGQSLHERLKTAPLPACEAIVCTRSILDALANLHAHGIVHRDLKPRNVMLLNDGSCRLLDLGLASRSAAVDEDETPTMNDASGEHSFGTPAYISPEQISEERVGPRSDLYAVGLLLFELLTGVRPFRGDPVEVLRARIGRPAPRLRSVAPALSAALEALVARALARSPEHRFASASEMTEALAAVPEAGAQ